MTDDGSPFDEDGEWVTNVPDDGQDETADDQLVRGTNLNKEIVFATTGSNQQPGENHTLVG